MKKELPRIGVTIGDPAGVGPEIVLKALSSKDILDICNPIIIGDMGILRDDLNRTSIKTELKLTDSFNAAGKGRAVYVRSLTSLKSIKKGCVSKEGGHASGLYIGEGVSMAMDGEIDALVTAPINKESFHMGGFQYPGHTEFLAHLTESENYAMMLMGESLRVILLTTHCPLSEVPSRLNIDDTLRIIRLTSKSLKDYFGLARPRLALAALNPHGGEAGLFGGEEKDILLPAIRSAQKDGLDIKGPFPSDTLFYQALKGKFDAVICPYHDQALIPLKLLHFDDGVNITLGLPIIRTSPDHGTAYDIAGKNMANPESMKMAIKTAVGMAAKKNSHCKN